MAARFTDSPGWLSLTRTEFETVLIALESDTTERAREEAQDVLQSQAPRHWLEKLEDVENARRTADG